MPVPPASSNDAPWYLRPWISQGILLAVALILLLPGTSTIPLMDRDEPRFAQATWEMIERGEWIIPYVNDEYRLAKPILSYWWMRPHFWIFGKTELAARLHSFASAFLTALVIQSMGGFLFSRRAGFFAALAWLSCFQVLVHGRLCVADMPMMLGIVITMWAVFRLLIPEDPLPRFNRWFWVLVAGVSIGFLAKGPIATATPFLGLLLARFVFYRQPIEWKRFQLWPLLGLSLVAIGIWGIPALIVTKGQFYSVGIGENVIKRGTEAFNGRISFPGAYFITALISLLPWSAFIPSAFRRAEGEPPIKQDLAKSLLLGWFLAPFIIFTPYATQLPHYVMPGFPAFFLLLTRIGGIPAPRNWPEGANRWLRRTGYFIMALAPVAFLAAPKLATQFPGIGGPSAAGLLVIGGILCGLSLSWFWTVTAMFSLGALAWIVTMLQVPWPEAQEPVRFMLICGGVLVLALGLSPIALRSRRLLAVIPLGAAGLIAFSLFASTLRSLHPVIALKPHFPERDFSAEAQFRAWKFTEPSLVFYTSRGWEWRSKEIELATASRWTESRPLRATVLLLQEWTLASQVESLLKTGHFTAQPSLDARREVLAHFPESRFQIHTISGVNMARSSWVTVILCRPLPEAESK